MRRVDCWTSGASCQLALSLRHMTTPCIPEESEDGRRVCSAAWQGPLAECGGALFTRSRQDWARTGLSSFPLRLRVALAQGGLERPQPGWASAVFAHLEAGGLHSPALWLGRLESRASLREHCGCDGVGLGQQHQRLLGAGWNADPRPHPTPADPGSLGNLPFNEAPHPGDSAAPEVGEALPGVGSWASGLQPPPRCPLLVLRWLALVQHRPQLRHQLPAWSQVLRQRLPGPARLVPSGSSGELYSRRAQGLTPQEEICTGGNRVALGKFWLLLSHQGCC